MSKKDDSRIELGIPLPDPNVSIHSMGPRQPIATPGPRQPTPAAPSAPSAPKPPRK